MANTDIILLKLNEGKAIVMLYKWMKCDTENDVFIKGGFNKLPFSKTAKTRHIPVILIDTQRWLCYRIWYLVVW